MYQGICIKNCHISYRVSFNRTTAESCITAEPNAAHCRKNPGRKIAQDVKRADSNCNRNNGLANVSTSQLSHSNLIIRAARHLPCIRHRLHSQIFGLPSTNNPAFGLGHFPSSFTVFSVNRPLNYELEASKEEKKRPRGYEEPSWKGLLFGRRGAEKKREISSQHRRRLLRKETKGIQPPNKTLIFSLSKAATTT